MNYAGYDIMFKKTNQILPFKYINSYQATPNQRIDVDSFRNEETVLNRNVAQHTSTKMEWTTPYLWINEWEELMALIRNNYDIKIERRIQVTFYDMEDCVYKDGYMYIPDFTAEIRHLENGDTFVMPVTFNLIEY